MRDFLGTEISPGAKVIYAWRRGSDHGLSKGIVTGTVQRGGQPALRVVRLEHDRPSQGDHRPAQGHRLAQGDHQEPRYMTVLGAVPVVELDRLTEAYSAQDDARRKYYSHTCPITWAEYHETETVTVAVFNQLWGD